MEVKTKYNTGDFVYCIYNNSVKKGVISEIEIKVRGAHDFINTFVEYVIPSISNHQTFSEERCFETKEELLKSL